jgi:hypothetical protein
MAAGYRRLLLQPTETLKIVVSLKKNQPPSRIEPSVRSRIREENQENNLFFLRFLPYFFDFAVHYLHELCSFAGLVRSKKFICAGPVRNRLY